MIHSELCSACGGPLQLGVGLVIGPPKKDSITTTKHKKQKNRSLSFHFDFFPAHKLFAKKQWKGLGARRIFWIVQWSRVSGVCGVGGVVFLEKVICMYIIRSGSMSWLTWCTLFLVWTHIFRVIDENVRKNVKKRRFKNANLWLEKYIIL